MARIAGVDLPRNKRMDIALTYIYGIGRKTALDILDTAGVSRDTRTDNLDEQGVRRIRDVIEGGFKVEGDLRRERTLAIKTFDGPRLLPRSSSQAKPSGPRTANQHQRTHAQRAQAHGS